MPVTPPSEWDKIMQEPSVVRPEAQLAKPSAFYVTRNVWSHGFHWLLLAGGFRYFGMVYYLGLNAAVAMDHKPLFK